jgi:hypothetical protein
MQITINIESLNELRELAGMLAPLATQEAISVETSGTHPRHPKPLRLATGAITDKTMEPKNKVRSGMFTNGFPPEWQEKAEMFIKQNRAFRFKDINDNRRMNNTKFRKAFRDWLASLPNVKVSRESDHPSSAYIFTPFKQAGGKTTYATPPTPKSDNYLRTPPPRPVKYYHSDAEEQEKLSKVGEG